MIGLSFNQELITYLAENRSDVVTEVFQFFSFMGEIEGYLLLVTLVFVAFSKRLAIQSSIVVLVAMTANHLIKIFVKNPRPFVSDGTHFDDWAVSAKNAAELAAEYSTPSGHAMAAAAFYGYLFFRTENKIVRSVLVLAIILVGTSRPIIGCILLKIF